MRVMGPFMYAENREWRYQCRIMRCKGATETPRIGKPGHVVYRALSGRLATWYWHPRAMPWAIICQPFRLEGAMGSATQGDALD